MDQNKQQSAQEKSFSAVIVSLDTFIKSTKTLQETFHESVLVPATLHAWKYGEPRIIATILNKVATEVSRTIRVESVDFWFREIAGFRVNLDSAAQTYSVGMNSKGQSNIDPFHKFTYDKAHATILRNKAYRYWKIAPVKLTQIQVIDDLPKFFDGVEKRLALALLAGSVMEADLLASVEKLVANVKKDMADSKIKAKAAEYIDQHSKDTSAPKESTDVE